MTFLEYTLLHMAISMGILGGCIWINRKVQWVEGGMLVATGTASIIALIACVFLGVLDWWGYF